MPLRTPLLFCALGLAACSSSSPSSATASSSGTPPSSDTLCELRIGQSTPTDAVTLLGTPTFRADSADGSVTLEYQYLSSSAVVDLRFTTQKTFSGATTLNLPQPACWNADGGH